MILWWLNLSGAGTKAGVRGMFAFWMGGASAVSGVAPVGARRALLGVGR